MSDFKHAFILAICHLLQQSCAIQAIGNDTLHVVAAPKTPKAIIDKMHAVCASMGDTLQSTYGLVGDDDSRFSCADKDGVWYSIRWGDVK